MILYWLKDRQEQEQFSIRWVPGKHNLADYHTKHHPGSHHRQVRPIYLYEEDQSPTTLQGYIEILTGEGQGKRRTSMRSTAALQRGSAHAGTRENCLSSLKQRLLHCLARKAYNLNITLV